jgi:hypothetical protein
VSLAWLGIHVAHAVLHALAAHDLPGGLLVDQPGQEFQFLVGVVDGVGRGQ